MAGVWLPFRSVAHLCKNARTYYKLLTHTSTPFYIKSVAIMAVIYLLSPLDMVPDWLAGFGIVDDIVVVSLLLGFVVRFLNRTHIE